MIQPAWLQIDNAASALGRVTRQVVDNLGAAIISGQYRADELLPVEAELCAKFGASRSTLREAVKVLNAKGLLTTRRRRGTAITPSSHWNLFDPDVLEWILRSKFSLPLLIEFTDVRLGIEPRAAALAATAATNDELANIQAGFDRMVAAIAGDDDALEADLAFHLAILEASGNRFYRRLKPLVTAALHFSIRYTDSATRTEDVKLKRHRRVLKAILGRDASAAADAAEALLLQARGVLEQGLARPMPGS